MQKWKQYDIEADGMGDFILFLSNFFNITKLEL